MFSLNMCDMAKCKLTIITCRVFCYREPYIRPKFKTFKSVFYFDNLRSPIQNLYKLLPKYDILSNLSIKNRLQNQTYRAIDAL